MRTDRIGQAWPRGSRCRRARRLRLQRKQRATPSIAEAPAVSDGKQPGGMIHEHRAPRLFPVGVLIACVAIILGIVFLLF
jgi:hypothetical protein